MKLFIAIALFSLFLYSCRQADIVTKAPDTQAVSASLANIDKSADAAASKAPVVAPEMATIKTETKNIGGQNVNSEKVVKALQQAQKDLRKEKEENTKLLAWLKVAAFVAGFALIVGALVFHWPTFSLAICSFTVWAALVAYGVVSTHAVLITGILGAIFFLAVGYYIWKNKTANKDLVKFGEGVKLVVPPATKEAIFGDNGLASKLQSKSTQNLVSKIRSKLGFKNLSKTVGEQSAAVDSASNTNTLSAPSLPQAKIQNQEPTPAELELALIEQARQNGVKVAAQIAANSTPFPGDKGNE